MGGWKPEGRFNDPTFRNYLQYDCLFDDTAWTKRNHSVNFMHDACLTLVNKSSRIYYRPYLIGIVSAFQLRALPSWCLAKWRQTLWPILLSDTLIYGSANEATVKSKTSPWSLWRAGYKAPFWNRTSEIIVYHCHWITLSLKRGQWKEICVLWTLIFSALLKLSTMW